MMKQNNLLLLALKQIFELSSVPCNTYRFVSAELGMVRSVKGTLEVSEQIFMLGQPYRLTEGRILLMHAGYIRVRANLIEFTLSVKQLIVASPGTILQVLEVSNDCELEMLAFINSLMEGWQKETLLQMFLQGRLYVQLDLAEKEEKRIQQFFDMLWDVVHDETFPREIVRSLIAALFHQIYAYRMREMSEDKQQRTRQEEVFNRFLLLVNKYAIRERNIIFYAERLYLTPRYLSTLIRQTSGRTVMDWVNEAVVQEAKLLLRHSDKLVYQIADELNFPNASFFCKYFRRLTGKTPHEYRLGE